MIEVVEKLEGLTPITHDIYLKMAEIFEKNMPKSLYMDFYEFAEITDTEPDVWEQFLDITEVQRYIQAKISKMSEYAAKKALHKLTEDRITSQDVQAIKEILNNAKLMQQNTNKRPQVILTFIPKSEIIEN